MMFLRAAVVMSNKLAGLELTDAHCGFRGFRASAAPKLRISQNRMAHASDCCARSTRAACRIPRSRSRSAYTDHSRAKGQSGFQAVRILFDYFFARHDHPHHLARRPRGDRLVRVLKRNRLPIHIVIVLGMLAIGGAAVLFPSRPTWSRTSSASAAVSTSSPT